MSAIGVTNLNEAFNSMLRTDYISLNDVGKLALLSRYYVDYFGALPEVLSDTDQLIVGRRGTGKTTLLYRGIVACMESWGTSYLRTSGPAPRTLGIYIDLGKCQHLDDIPDTDFSSFEHAFVSELCDAITDQLNRYWPSIAKEPSFFSRLFRAAEAKKIIEVRELLDKLGKALKEGLPRLVDQSSPVVSKDLLTSTISQSASISAGAQTAGPTVDAKLADSEQDVISHEKVYTTKTGYRLTVADIIRILAQLREKANLSATYVFIDEFSGLSVELQRRFSTLLKKLLGSHAGVYVKLCAITDKYTLGSSIILQRDLFELSLDLDMFVERSGTLNDAMNGLREYVERIIRSRLEAYKCPPPEDVFDDLEDAWVSLSRSAMGVPRTLGIVLKQAWNRSTEHRKTRRIRKTDLSYGIRHASTTYLNQLLGASRDSVAIPAFHADIWHAILSRAQEERKNVRDAAASHFLVLARNEQMVSVLNMFFLVHLLTKSRTTKKESQTRSLYCLDYGICQENNLGFASDKNIIRQQRFAYDDVLARYEKYFGITAEVMYRCPTCASTYTESELNVAGIAMRFCPRDRSDLIVQGAGAGGNQYTEEETKIIGTMRSSRRGDHVFARQVADDVGCYVQKVAKFGEKLERNGVVKREKDTLSEKMIYFGLDQ